jgi:hypothetical protein
MTAHCTIIIASLNSHEFVRRQVLHLHRTISDLKLAHSIHVILLDDGSDPPLPAYDYPWLTQIWTNDRRPWTQGIARNWGAGVADSPYLLFTDIDHILSRQVIAYAAGFKRDFAQFRRRQGYLDESGRIAGVRGFVITTHRNTYLIRRDLFFHWGGYANRPLYADDRWIGKRLRTYTRRGLIRTHMGPIVYVCQTQSYFHKLRRSR